MQVFLEKICKKFFFNLVIHFIYIQSVVSLDDAFFENSLPTDTDGTQFF